MACSQCSVNVRYYWNVGNEEAAKVTGKLQRKDKKAWPIGVRANQERESAVTPTSELFKKWWKQWQFVGKSFGKMCRFSCEVVDSFWVLFSFRGKMCGFLWDNQNILKWAACLVYSFNTYIRKINSVVWHLVHLSLIWNIHLWIIRRTTMDFFIYILIVICYVWKFSDLVFLKF